ncbi:MAG: peptidylprolyl isomerase [Acidobacteria bacterium]|nr:peptidylprolyl isomerase [Acidobacteriota bacterium]
MNASPWRRLWREPLTRFFLAGAGLFVLYALVGGGAPPDDRHIVIDRYELETLAALWQAQWRRPPTRDELTRLVGDRVREEVLYREALALDLDENDVLVRRRLAEKLEMALNDVAATAEPSADDLRRYFESHAGRYVEPARLTLTHRFFSRDRRGDSAEADARRALASLAAGGTVDDDSFHASKTLTLEDAERLEWIFGTAFRDAVLEHAGRPGPRHAWFGPVSSAFGAHLVRMDAYTEGRPRTLDEVRETVLDDWRRDHVAARESERYAEMRARYAVDVAPFASIGDLVQP